MRDVQSDFASSRLPFDLKPLILSKSRRSLEGLSQCNFQFPAGV